MDGADVIIGLIALGALALAVWADVQSRRLKRSIEQGATWRKRRG